MKLPPKIRVGAMWYTLVRKRNLASLGEFDMDSGEIRVRAGLDDLTTATTLLHEIIHAIADTMGGRMSESQVRCLEQGLGIVGQDNPEFFMTLMETICSSGTK